MGNDHRYRDAYQTDRHISTSQTIWPGKRTLTSQLVQRVATEPASAPRQTRDANGVADGAEHAVAAAASSSGAALPDPVMRKFESSLGADLSRVRVHTDGASAASADAVGAKAYTMGNDIHFGAGRYDPEGAAGLHLLAHEVAHTVQQSGGAQRTQFKLAVSSSTDAAEHEADRAADAMVSDAPFALGGGGGVQRDAIQRDAADPPAPAQRGPTTPENARAQAETAPDHPATNGEAPATHEPASEKPPAVAAGQPAANVAAEDKGSEEAQIDLTGFGGPRLPVQGMKRNVPTTLFTFPAFDAHKIFNLFNSHWLIPMFPGFPVAGILASASLVAELHATGKGSVMVTWNGTHYVVDAAYGVNGSARVVGRLRGGVGVDVIVESGGVALEANGELSVGGEAKLDWKGMQLAPGGTLAMPTGVQLTGKLHDPKNPAFGGVLMGGIDLVAWVHGFFHPDKEWRGHLGGRKPLFKIDQIPFGYKFGPGAGPSIFSGTAVTQAK